jgi:hypothetical protein
LLTHLSNLKGKEGTVNQPPHGFAGSSPASPTKGESLVSNSFARCRLRPKRVSCDGFCGRTSYGRIALRGFSFVSVSSPRSIRRADPMVQVDYLLVVESNIGASKTDDLLSAVARVPLSAEPESDCLSRLNSLARCAFSLVPTLTYDFLRVCALAGSALVIARPISQNEAVMERPLWRILLKSFITIGDARPAT